MERVKTIPHSPSPDGQMRVRKIEHGSDDRAGTHYAVHGAWICHTGKLRRMNEDACLAGTALSDTSIDTPSPFSIDAEPWIVAVSDGIGGHRAGAEASREVVEALADCKRVTPYGVADILQRVNRRLCERGLKDSEFAAMGATVAGIGCGRREIFAFNVGDSRVYREEGGRLTQITRDDSEAEELIDQGLLKSADGLRPGFLHALTQAIGGREEVIEIEVHIHPLHIDEHARFVICSDGLTDMVPASEIAKIMAANGDATAAVAALFTAAMDAGGLDNITITVVEVERR
jgi:serine/threonine protein phosphatase PrpC